MTISLEDRVPHVTKADVEDARRTLLKRLITPDWLTACLSERSPGVEVRAVKIGEIVSGASTKGFLIVDYAPDGNPHSLPTNLVVKGGFEDYTPRIRFTHLNEMRFYQDIAPTIPLTVPNCFYAGIEPTEGHPIVIIENLNEKAARFNTIYQPFTYAEVAGGLAALARFHAQTWNSPEFEPGGRLDWVVDTISGEFGAIHDYFFEPAIWERFTRTSQFTAVSMVFHDAERVRSGLQRLSEYHSSLGTSCVVHGDCHEGNTFSLPDGTMGLLDFQVKRSPWSQDVSEFIVGTLDIASRRRWEADLLRVYLRHLRVLGVDAPDFDEAWATHKRQLFYGLFKWLINESFWQIEAINTANTARYGAACLDHQTLELLLG